MGLPESTSIKPTQKGRKYCKTIPLLANTQTRSSKNRVTWTLKFTLPAPAEEGTTRRFSAVPGGYGPSGAHALKGAVRHAHPFDCKHETLTSSPCQRHPVPCHFPLAWR